MGAPQLRSRLVEEIDGQLVLDRIDSRTGIVKLNPTWLRAQGYGRHVEDDGATIRVGDHVFRRVQHLREPFGAYQAHIEPVA